MFTGKSQEKIGWRVFGRSLLPNMVYVCSDQYSSKHSKDVWIGNNYGVREVFNSQRYF